VAAIFTPAARSIFAKRVLLHLATIGSDGEPHVTPVWTELDGDDIIINTALGRKKARNLANDPRVAISLTDPDDPGTCIAARGLVVGFSTQGADDVIDRLARKYTGEDFRDSRVEGEVRVTVRIRPELISVQPD
jgi:PPOX class probable F420-dependent enzyme